MSSHAAYLRHFEAYEPELEKWRLRAQELEKPEPGSDLHEDNKAFLHPISDEARLSLISAGEHLRLAWTAIKAKELYPSAHFTTLRGALVAASQAVYILGPTDSATRRGRGLAVIVESNKRLRQYHAECLRMPGLTDSDVQKIQQQLNWLNERIDGARAAGAQKMGVNVSDQVIPYAAALVFDSKPDLQHTLMLLWRQMSGDAHALAWALTLRAQLDPPKEGQILSTGTVGGSLQDIAEPFEGAFRILKRGWSLFDQRCRAEEHRFAEERMSG
ncbi:hypothetical protein [Arthrobacter sp. 4R501]|uniref:hypothetical protein n=1 Tax=Arthrobacter sp. 4R501 TaxID=2058886 RepID=UPI0011B0CB91|nr:hypothetical protein [Arthrobacter sp. 4R501]